MTTEIQKSESKALTIQERAKLALGLVDYENTLTELVAKSADIVTITNDDGYAQVHAMRMVLKNERVDIEKKGKAARDDANAFSKAVIAAERRLIEIIKPEEERLHGLQKAVDDAKERERQAKIEAEQKRVEAIQKRITEIRLLAVGVHSMAAIQRSIAALDLLVIDESFEEFQPLAKDVKLVTLSVLQGLLDSALKNEAEQARIKAERAELEKLRKEAAEREAAEKAAREKAEGEARAKREAEEAEARKVREEEARKQREALEAERKKQAEEQARIDAENKRLAEERAAFEREQREAKRKAEAEAQRKAIEEAAERKRKEEAEAKARKLKFPGEAAIVDALASHFGVPHETVRGWLLELRAAA